MGNLNLTPITANQNNKYLTANNADEAIDVALTEKFVADITSGNVVMTDAQYRAQMFISIENGATTGRTVTLPAIKKLSMVSCDAGNTDDVDLIVGSTTLTMSPGDVVIVYTDGTTNGLVTLAGGSGGGAATQYFSIVSFDYTTDTAVGDGAGYFHIPPALTGMNLTYVHAEVITAGTTGTTDIQIYNVTDAVDMLSTKLTIDTGETGSDTAVAPAVIDAANDDVATNDLIRIDVDAISTTAAKGLLITLGFEAP